MSLTKVSCCGDCPFAAREKEMYCSHNDAPKGYENLIGWDNMNLPNNFKIIRGGLRKDYGGAPKWCPLRKESYHEEIFVNGTLKSERKIEFKS